MVFVFSDFIGRVRRVLQDNKGHVRIYGGFCVALLLMYFVFSDGDFSFLLTLSSLVSLLSFMIVSYCIESAKSCKGISMQTMQCYVVLLLSRLFAIVPHQGYLPSDSSGDFLYQSSEFFCLVLAVYVVYLCRKKYQSSYEAENDNFNGLYILVPSFILAIIFHPSLNRSFLSDVSWAFALYVETFCVLPQLIMFQRCNLVIPSTAHFTAAQSCAKILAFIFWFSTYGELNSKGNLLKPFVGHWVIFTQFVQILLVADFFFHYLKCLTRGIPVELLMSENV